MNKKQKDEQLKLFAEAFHEVVLPLLENMATKDDIRAIRENMATKDDIRAVREEMATKDDIDRIELKLVNIDDRLDRHGKSLDNYEKRIRKVESHVGLTST